MTPLSPITNASIRTEDGRVFVLDPDIGTVIAPSEFEAAREIERRKSRPPVNAWDAWTVPHDAWRAAWL